MVSEVHLKNIALTIGSFNSVLSYLNRSSLFYFSLNRLNPSCFTALWTQLTFLFM